ncbi:MAG: hypothetical protein RLZZ334_357 [Actinomycetota bacterium]|jgi:hypothetical protein
MKKNYSRKAKALVLFTAISFLFSQAVPANAANTTITCYKGTTVKKVTAAKPKCPTGYTTTKPKATSKPVAGASIAFAGTYKGKLSIVWGDTYLQVTAVKGEGTGNVLGLTDMSGTGAAAPAGICDTFDAKGSIAGGGNSLNVTFDSTAKGCAEDESAPTTIKITGTATVTGGTGKYAGATGTLKVTGTFSVKGGSKEDAAFTMDVSGNIKTK